MKSGFVQSSVFHSGHLSKRRNEARTRGSRSNRTVPPLALAHR